MRIMVYSLLRVVQDLYHQPYQVSTIKKGKNRLGPGGMLCWSSYAGTIREEYDQ